MVDCGFKLGTDKRLRQLFETEAAATEWAAAKKAEYLAVLEGRQVEAKQGSYARLSSLTETQRQHIVQALGRVGGDTARIIRALAYYEKHAATAEASRTLKDVFTEYMAAKEAAGRRRRTLVDARNKLNPFVTAFGSQPVTAIATGDVEGWLNARGYSASTRNAYRVAIVGLFNHACKRRYADHNPAAVIEAVSVDQGLPAIHTPKQVRALLQAASKLATPKARSKVVPYLAIGYFAGLRPENELANLDWADIDFEACTIRVDPATAKKRRQRYVDMSDNLVAWLTPYVQRTGKIGCSRLLLRKARKAAGVAWVNDVMRHSFGSYLLALNEDAARTASQMGHSDASVLFNHYRNLVKKATATEYWKIVPEKNGAIIQLPVLKAG